MSRRSSTELPEEQQEQMRKAVRLSWMAIAFQLSAVTVVFLVMGSSQAMKAAWIEDALGLVPPIAFLIAQRRRQRGPDRAFPWGHQRAPTVAFLVSATTLVIMGLYVVYDSASKLLMFEHTTIGLAVPFGVPVWAGFTMAAAMAYTVVPAVLLGRRITACAGAIEDKSFHAEGAMLRADWLTAVGTIIGVLGVGLGVWWFDAGVALLIGVDIVHDGWTNLMDAVEDLMDRAPQTIDGSDWDDTAGQVEEHLRGLAWVDDVRVRMREQGHVLSGDAFVVPVAGVDDLARCLVEAERSAYDISWRVHDLVVTAVPSLTEADVPEPPHA